MNGVFLDLASVGAVPRFNDTLGFVTRGLSYIAFHPDYDKVGSPGAGKLYTLYKTYVPGAQAPDYHQKCPGVNRGGHGDGF